MEHSQAIMEDAARVVEGANNGHPDALGRKRKKSPPPDARAAEEQQDQRAEKKRKYGDARLKHGSRGGNNATRDARRNKKGGMGRGEYFQSNPDKRAKINATRKKLGTPNEDDGGEVTESVSLKSNPIYSTLFSKEEIETEERRPKRKVAVMIGYSGTGYKGMQLSPSERTIEGDLFVAFVKAGAISKANADDPKKASLVRCARTDKGVHAAGNMISLKLIVEDGEEEVVRRINEHLSPQIRVWGIERTTGSFSCYQACDSRWYEYLIPSHAFLPPHPSSWLAKKCEEHAQEVGQLDQYRSRQEEVQGFWERVDHEEIRPIIESLDADIRFDVVKALQGEEEAQAKAAKLNTDDREERLVRAGGSVKAADEDQLPTENHDNERSEEAVIIINEPFDTTVTSEGMGVEGKEPHASVDESDQRASAATETASGGPPTPQELERLQRLRAATKRLRAAYNASKRRYRIPQVRIQRIQDALDRYIGTKNYHNFTVAKTFHDPSAKRNIKSFKVNPTPILIGDGPDDGRTEWLSMKVHGQSFMMHQIRKMVGMVSLLVRCGSDPSTIDHALASGERYSVPKVPGLGLLLERPVFDSYNAFTATKHERGLLSFDKFEDKIDEFKRREIYDRMFREEEERNEFQRFFNHIDNFKEPYFLFVTAKGHAATAESVYKGSGDAPAA